LIDKCLDLRIGSPERAFDFDAAERAEILREHEALQTMLMAHLKNDALRTATRGALLHFGRRPSVRAV